MARFDAMSITWEKVEVLGQEGLFTDLRIKRDTVPKGWYMYEVRHDDNDWGDPVQICLGVLVNHFGTLLVKEHIELELSYNMNNAYVDIDPEEDWNYLFEMFRFDEGA